MANNCCANCTKYLKLMQYDYLPTGKVVHTQMGGYVCLAFASEGVAIWMCGLKSEETPGCEVFLAREKNET